MPTCRDGCIYFVDVFPNSGRPKGGFFCTVEGGPRQVDYMPDDCEKFSKKVSTLTSFM